MKILVTGGSGFVGVVLLKRLVANESYNVVAALRRDLTALPANIDIVHTDDIGADFDWTFALSDIDVIIHAAGRAHIMRDNEAGALVEFRRVNVDGTLNLARQAASAGVNRFIFISSVKVNGETTQPGFPFTERDLCCPQDPYAISKYEAEQGLRKIADESDFEVVIIRPPLVYGPGVKGNFQSMIHWLDKKIPLPLGAITNQRSLVGVDNLVDLIISCIDHPAAANQTFLVADGEDLSTTELLRRLGLVKGRKVCLVPVPTKMLELAVGLIGKNAIAHRLCGNLQVDISKVRDVLGWEPPVSVDEGLKRCVADISKNVVKVDSVLIRLLDIVFSFLGLIAGSPLLLVLAILGLFDTGSPIFRQQRVGRRQQPFVLVKFRTMKINTVSVATHLASASSITRFGRFLRKSKLDELPQLWNVLKGEMSLVGPRPCLFNQEELIRERASRNVFDVRPGVTGLAQLNNIDMSTPELLAKIDARMINDLTVGKYFSYIIQTAAGKGAGDRVNIK